MSRVGTKIYSLRTAKGLTQKQLAKMVGVTEKFIDEVESGKRVLGIELLNRISKLLEQDMSELETYETLDEPKPERKVVQTAKPGLKETQKVWSDAFDAILKTVQVYDYSLEKQLGSRQLPVVANKVEGYPKDKVAFIEIQDNDMIGFRIGKGDTAFIYLAHEFENNAICLVEYDKQRVVRQLKKLEGDRILIVSNNGRLMTETASIGELKIIARLVRLEIKL